MQEYVPKAPHAPSHTSFSACVVHEGLKFTGQPSVASGYLHGINEVAILFRGNPMRTLNL